jgi:fucose permease
MLYPHDHVRGWLRIWFMFVKQRGLLLIIAYLGFISLGLPDALIGVAWPSLRRDFGQPLDGVAVIFFGFGLSYFVSSFLTGRLLKSCGIGMLLALSSLLVALSGVTFASAPVWALFAAGALLHGLGSGAIDAGLNHYVAHHFSARHMTWLHACYSLGATFGPVIMTAMIANTGSWRGGYAIVATLLLLLSLLFFATRKSWGGPPSLSEQEERTGGEIVPVSLGVALRSRVLWLHFVLFFVYTGLEVSVGQWSFSVLTEDRGLEKGVAGMAVTAYWASIGVGRVLAGVIVEKLGINPLLRGCMLMVAVGTGLFMAGESAAVSIVSLILSGLGMSAIFPCLMTSTPVRLGAAVAAHGIGIQVSAAMLGAAALPSLCGVIAQRAGLPAIAVATLVMALVLLVVHEGVLMLLKRRRSVITG